MTNVVKFPASRQMTFAEWLERRGYRAASLALSRGSVARAVELVPKYQRTIARALAAEVLAQRQRAAAWRRTKAVARETRELQQFIFLARGLIARYRREARRASSL